MQSDCTDGDRNYSVIALLEDDAGDADDERMRYTPYGEVRTTLRSDVNQDGTVTNTGSGWASDRGVVSLAAGNDIGDPGYIVEADLNRDGTIDSTDSGLVSADLAESIAAGVLSEHGCLVGYNGYIVDPATGSRQTFGAIGNRTVDPTVILRAGGVLGQPPIPRSAPRDS